MATSHTRTRPPLRLYVHPKHRPLSEPASIWPQPSPWPFTLLPRCRWSALCGRALVNVQEIEMAPLAEAEAEYIETEPAEVHALACVVVPKRRSLLCRASSNPASI